jgi:hypothetical protein
MLMPWGKTKPTVSSSTVGASRRMRALSSKLWASPRRRTPVPAPPLQAEPSILDKGESMAGEKRDLARVPLGGLVQGEVMVFQPMTILDISPGGAQIETTFALQLDSLHDFRLSLGERSIVVKGRIAHCHIGELTEVAALYRTGVEFVSMSEPARDAIASFVSEARYHRESLTVVDGVVTDDTD